MQGKLVIQCRGCGRKLDAELEFDTADATEDLGWSIIRELLRHRQACPFYRQSGPLKNGVTVIIRRSPRLRCQQSV